MHGTSPHADQGPPIVSGAGAHDPESGRRASAPRAYCYRHRVSFEETNLVGNVYFARYISWQGRCRELFLLEHAPSVLGELERSLRLVTLNVACEFYAELRAMDELEVVMSLAHQRQHRIGLAFDYRLLRRASDRAAQKRSADDGADRASAVALVARGTQELGCMQHTAGGLVPCPVPAELSAALDAFR